MVGIYKITNNINKKVYIGQSIDIKRRWRGHKSTATNPNDECYNLPLYRAIRKYGIENFIFEVLEECNVSELNEKERFYIQKYNSYFNGYNLTLGGDSSRVKLAPEIVKGIISDLENTELTQVEIGKKWSVHENTVQSINTGRTWHLEREYPIRQTQVAKEYFCIDCGKKISRGCSRCLKCNSKYHRVVERPTREELKILIRNKTFVDIGKMFNVSDNAVRKWCKLEGLPFKRTEIKRYSDEEWNNI